MSPEMCEQCPRIKRQLNAKNHTIKFLRLRLSKINENDTNRPTDKVQPSNRFSYIITPSSQCHLTPINSEEAPIRSRDDVNNTPAGEMMLPKELSLAPIIRECFSLQEKLRSGIIGGTTHCFVGSSSLAPLHNTRNTEMKILDILRGCVESTNQLCRQLQNLREENRIGEANAKLLREELEKELNNIQIKTKKEQLALTENKLRTTENKLQKSRNELKSATKRIGILEAESVDANEQVKLMNKVLQVTKNDLQSTKNKLVNAIETINELNVEILEKAYSDGDCHILSCQNEDYAICDGSLTQIVSKIDDFAEEGKNRDPDIIRVEKLVVNARKSMEMKVNLYLSESWKCLGNTATMSHRGSLCDKINMLSRMNILYPPPLIDAMHKLRKIGNSCAHDNNNLSRGEMTGIIRNFEAELARCENRKRIEKEMKEREINERKRRKL